MPRTLGVFHEHHRSADFLWNQCEGGHGESGAWEVRSGDGAADHVLVINWVVGPEGLARSRGWRRPMYKLLRRSTTPLRIRPGYEWLDRPRDRTWALVFEPPPYASDWYYEYTRSRCERVYGPDPRATHPCVLPTMWTFDEDLAALRAMPPPAKPWPLATVTSGRQLLGGHATRMEFLRRIRAEGMPLKLFGRGLPADMAGLGEVASKASALRPARFALVIENYAEGDQYITEKLWDALLCWCLPVYFGSRAADGMIPPEAIVRLPDLRDSGIEVLRQTLATPDLWERRLPAIAEARRRVMGDLRLVEWVKRELAAAGR